MTSKKPRLPCSVHRYHWPPSLTVHEHHVFPLGMGGADEPANKVWVCPSGHMNIHNALDALLNGREMRGTREEQRLAQRGFDEFQAGGSRGHVFVLPDGSGELTSVDPASGWH